VLVGLGRLQLMRGNAREAEPLLTEALEIRTRAYPAGDTRTGEAQVALGRCLAALGRPDQAASLLVDGLTAMRQRAGRPDRLIREGATTLAALGVGPAASTTP
jgi:hypothetical protein